MGTTTGSDIVISLTRVYAAPRERVFKAWTDTEDLKRWWGVDAGWTTPIAEVDLRPGGSYRLGMKPPDKDEVYVVAGRFLEIEQPSRLVYTWAWEAQPGPETLVTVHFHDRGGSTEVALTHERFADAASRDQHAQGWTGCLNRLTAVVGG
jgi:uncharacterized protein YndB with AHSA1/START domain